MLLKKIWPALLGAALLLSCTTVPNIRPVSPVEGVPGVAALWQATNTDENGRMNLDEWLDFLYARGPIPDPKNPKKMLPAKGPAVCVSSEDWRKNETAMAELCAKGKCSYDQEKLLERMKKFREKTN